MQETLTVQGRGGFGEQLNSLERGGEFGEEQRNNVRRQRRGSRQAALQSRGQLGACHSIWAARLLLEHDWEVATQQIHHVLRFRLQLLHANTAPLLQSPAYTAPLLG